MGAPGLPCEEGVSPPLRSSHGEGAPPLHPGGLSLNARGCAPLHSPRGSTAPTPSEERALRPSTPGDFPVAGKVTKGAPRAAPFGIPPVRGNRPLWCFASLAPGLLSATKKDRFATFRLWANRSFVLSGFCRRKIFCFHAVARLVVDEC